LSAGTESYRSGDSCELLSGRELRNWCGLQLARKWRKVWKHLDLIKKASPSNPIQSNLKDVASRTQPTARSPMKLTSSSATTSTWRWKESGNASISIGADRAIWGGMSFHMGMRHRITRSRPSPCELPSIKSTPATYSGEG